jgi:hypothetical protein
VKILRSEKGLMVTLDDSRESITVSDEHGRNFVEIQVSPGTVTVQASSQIMVQAPQIALMDGAAHPLVLGDQLLQYLNQLASLFNSHMHPGQTIPGPIPVTPAPPLPSVSPPTPGLLSTTVKTG